jgi:glutathione S-transferase
MMVGKKNVVANFCNYTESGEGVKVHYRAADLTCVITQPCSGFRTDLFAECMLLPLNLRTRVICITTGHLAKVNVRTVSSSTTNKMASRKGANYHIECTGAALQTAQAKTTAKPDKYGEEMTLFAANFCPFVQRIWIALEELKDIPYKYFEVDPYKKPKELLDVNPKGLVPALKIGNEGKCLAESTVLIEYLHDRYADRSTLLPKDPYQAGLQRLAADKVNRTMLPAFYRYLQAQDPEEQVRLGQEYVEELRAFEKGMQEEKDGVFWDGSDNISFVDIQAAPWLLRSKNVLHFYRGLDLDTIFEQSSRFSRYLSELLHHPAVKATTSTDDLYLDSYARYAENRPNTSQVANAINSGRKYANDHRRRPLTLAFVIGGLP